MDDSEKKYLEEREAFYLQDSIKNKAKYESNWVKYTLQVVNEASVIFSEIREFHIPNELRDEFFETKKKLSTFRTHLIKHVVKE